MALYSHGITLKQLLEDPTLLNAPLPKPISEKEKKDDFELDNIFAGASAFLGPNIWSKDEQIPYDQIPDFQLEYMDLDEFLNENGVNDPHQAPVHVRNGISPQLSPTSVHSGHHPVPTSIQNGVGPPVPASVHGYSPPAPTSMPALVRESVPPPLMTPAGSPHHVPRQKPESPAPCSVKILDRLQAPVDDACSHDNSEVEANDLLLAQTPGQEKFDPTQRKFSEEELRPQPTIKKSKKIYITDEMKDDKYWGRREKNNVAAKRSRDARRIKENQIAMRAAFLEKENSQLKSELEEANEQLEAIRAKLAKYEST